MSNHPFDFPEQICYVQCGFCSTILMVSIPCSSLSMEVTVRCGHCTSLLSVDMMKSSIVPLRFLASLSHVEPKEGGSEEDAINNLNSHNASMMTYSDCEEELNAIQMTSEVTKSPEKRQRTPSAYNCFIKEEIKRLKAQNPDMAHKEAFSTAAKNWANFPPYQCKGDQESYSHTAQVVDLDTYVEPSDAEVKEEGHGFRGRKVGKDTV